MKKQKMSLFLTAAMLAASIGCNTALAAETDSHSVAWDDFSAACYSDGQITPGDNGGTGWATGFCSDEECTKIVNYYDNPKYYEYFKVTDRGMEFLRQDNKLYRKLSAPIDQSVAARYVATFDMYISAASIAKDYDIKFYLGNEAFGGVKAVEKDGDYSLYSQAMGTTGGTDDMWVQNYYTVAIMFDIVPDGDSVVRTQYVPKGEPLKSTWDTQATVSVTEPIEYIKMTAAGWGATTYYANFAIDTYTADEWDSIISGFNTKTTYKNIEEIAESAKIGGRVSDLLVSYIKDSVVYENFDSYDAYGAYSDDGKYVKKFDTTGALNGALNGGFGFDSAWYFTGGCANAQFNINTEKQGVLYDPQTVMRRFLKNEISNSANAEYFVNFDMTNQDWDYSTAAASPEQNPVVNNQIKFWNGDKAALGSYTELMSMGLKYDDSQKGYVPFVGINGKITLGNKVILTKTAYETSHKYRYLANLSIKGSAVTVKLMVVNKTKGYDIQGDWDIVATGTLAKSINSISLNVPGYDSIKFDNIIIEKYTADEIAATENGTGDVTALRDGLAREYYTAKESFCDGKVSAMVDILANTENRYLIGWNCDYEKIKDKGVMNVIELRNGTGADKEVTVIFVAQDRVTRHIAAVKTHKVTLPANRYSGRINTGFAQEELTKFSAEGTPKGYVYRTYVFDGLDTMVPMLEKPGAVDIAK